MNLYEENKAPEIFDSGLIIVDILDELICGAYAPRIGICRLLRSKIWHDYCKDALNKLAIETVKRALQETEDPFLSYLTILSTRRKRFSRKYPVTLKLW